MMRRIAIRTECRRVASTAGVCGGAPAGGRIRYGERLATRSAAPSGEAETFCDAARRCAVLIMPLTAWRIGHIAVTCDGCGLETTCDRRPNGYAVLLATGSSEHPALVHRALWLGEPPLPLLCPYCSRRHATQ